MLKWIFKFLDTQDEIIYIKGIREKVNFNYRIKSKTTFHYLQVQNAVYTGLSEGAFSRSEGKIDDDGLPGPPEDVIHVRSAACCVGAHLCFNRPLGSGGSPLACDWLAVCFLSCISCIETPCLRQAGPARRQRDLIRGPGQTSL